MKMTLLSLIALMSLRAQAGTVSPFAECRARIAKIVCLVDPATGDENTAFKRPCLPGGEVYAPEFEGHFDRAPELIQEMYCHLNRVFIEKDFVGTAFAGIDTDANGRVRGGGVGIRREVLDQKIGMDHWLTWKEEASYGGSRHSTDPLLGVFQYRSLDASHEFFLDYVLAHEFGHLFDFANGLNDFEDCRDQQTPDGDWISVGACTPQSGSFAEISWERVDRARGANEYPLRNAQCSYFCNGHYIPREQSAAMFAQLLQTSFVSPYGSRYAGEDWAETFAVYLMSRERGWRWGVETQGTWFDLSAHFESDLLKTKRDYVRDFLSQPYFYPGEGPASQRLDLRRAIDR